MGIEPPALEVHRSVFDGVVYLCTLYGYTSKHHRRALSLQHLAEVSCAIAAERHLVGRTLVLFHPNRFGVALVAFVIQSHVQDADLAILWQGNLERSRSVFIRHQIYRGQFLPLGILHRQRQLVVRNDLHVIAYLAEYKSGSLHRLSWTIDAPVGHNAEVDTDVMTRMPTPVVVAMFPRGEVILCPEGTDVPVLV